MWQDVWQFFHTNAAGIQALAAGIQALAVVLALTYAVVQTRQIAKQLRLASVSASSIHYKELNQFILERDDVAALFQIKQDTEHADRADLAAGVVLAIFEARFLLREAGILNKKMRESDERSMIANFRLPTWKRYKSEYYEPFQDFIDGKILPKV